MTYKLIEKPYKTLKNFSHKFFLKEREKDDKTDVLIVSFYGEYPNGSLGNKHGSFIARKAIEGLMSFDVEAIILDFREMTYNYGNTLLKVFQDIYQFMDAGNEENDPMFPILVVISDKNEKGILSLLAPKNPEASSEFYFRDINKAISKATEKGKYWLDN